MAYEPLPIEQVDIEDLRLDLDNYRIPSKPGDEAAALNYLFASEDVLGAALLILRDGYFDNEVPIVTRGPDSDFVVLEGNRRVSALKALRDPELVPTHRGEVQALLKRYAVEAENLPASIRVLVTPSRESASRHVARLHTGLSKKRWSLDQQANFYYSLLADGRSVAAVKDDYPGTTIVRFIKMAVARRFLAGVAFSDRSLREFVTTGSLKMSAFEYAYRRDEIAAEIGLHFNEDGILIPKDRAAERIAGMLAQGQRAALEYLVAGFRSEKFSSRSPEFKKNSSELRQLVAKLQELASADLKPKESGAPSVTGSVQPTQQRPGAATPREAAVEAQEPARTRGANHPDTKPKLDLSGVDYSGAPINLKRRYFELQRINIVDFPVSAAILMRSTCEMTIKSHFEALGTPVSGELKAVLKVVRETYGQNKAVKGRIAAIESGTVHQPGSAFWLNAMAHDVNAVIEPQDVRAAWERVSPLLRFLLPQIAGHRQ